MEKRKLPGKNLSPTREFLGLVLLENLERTNRD